MLLEGGDLPTCHGDRPQPTVLMFNTTPFPKGREKCGRSLTLPVASVGGLLSYTEDGHSSQESRRSLVFPLLTIAPPPRWRRRRQTGMIMRMAMIALKRMQEMGPFLFLVNLNGMKKKTQRQRP
ncbi:unnamed protein product [Sphagnum jensenii]|uniref:Uncharacterized protein n=1 Tax=Sphagnum jensenii TaxID=128206 RepID=A0ABP1BI33_9BRYO